MNRSTRFACDCVKTYIQSANAQRWKQLSPFTQLTSSYVNSRSRSEIFFNATLRQPACVSNASIENAKVNCCILYAKYPHAAPLWNDGCIGTKSEVCRNLQSAMSRNFVENCLIQRFWFSCAEAQFHFKVLTNFTKRRQDI